MTSESSQPMQGQPSPDANEPSFALLDMQEPSPATRLRNGLAWAVTARFGERMRLAA